MNNLFVKEKATGMKITSSREVYNSCYEMVAADQELFMIIGFNTRNVEIFREVTFKGGLDSAAIDPKIIFRHLLLKNCSAFICVHNHPGGEKDPSLNDIKVTQKLYEVSKSITIAMMDHIIVSDDGFYSFADNQNILGKG